jgi:hypothetical protein
MSKRSSLQAALTSVFTTFIRAGFPHPVRRRSITSRPRPTPGVGARAICPAPSPRSSYRASSVSHARPLAGPAVDGNPRAVHGTSASPAARETPRLCASHRRPRPPPQPPRDPRSTASVQAEGELVEVGVEVIGADRALVGAGQPALEQAGDAMNALTSSRSSGRSRASSRRNFAVGSQRSPASSCTPNGQPSGAPSAARKESGEPGVSGNKASEKLNGRS